MITPIRIGALTLHFGNLCYAREATEGRLVLFMACGALYLDGEEAQIVREYLGDHSVEIGPARKRQGPQLPETGSVHTRTTLLLDPPNRK